MKILFITNLLPYPLDNGGKIKSYNTLKILCENNKVDLVCFHEDEEEKRYIANLKTICNEVRSFKKPITTNKNKK